MDHDYVVCSECGEGHFRWWQHGALTCNVCGKQVSMDDLEDVFYNPQWDVVVAIPQLSMDVIDAARRDLGITLEPWHTGGGCMALGATLPDGREVLVTDGDANLPGRHDSELFGGVFDPECPEEGEESAYSGESITDLVERIRDLT